MARYGPGEIPPIPNNKSKGDKDRNQLKSEFTTLLHAIINGTTPEEEYPSLLTQNMEVILNVIGISNAEVEGEGNLLEEIIQEDVRRHEQQQLDRNDEDGDGSSNYLDRVSEAVNLILSFVEIFVDETKSMDDVYKQLLGKIFQSIARGNNKASGDSSTAEMKSASASAMENELDNLLSNEKEAFTPGFLRHVEGECNRIASLPVISPESARMLQILRLIQTRVLEELGKGIGEGAIVLGQLLGYEDESERLAVLDAGLAVRGVEFANELAALTEEALEGFKGVPSGADKELVKSVEVIDERIRVFIGKMDFQ